MEHVYRKNFYIVRLVLQLDFNNKFKRKNLYNREVQDLCSLNG